MSCTNLNTVNTDVDLAKSECVEEINSSEIGRAINCKEEEHRTWIVDNEEEYKNIT